jgi:hypothetical protein
MGFLSKEIFKEEEIDFYVGLSPLAVRETWV